MKLTLHIFFICLLLSLCSFGQKLDPYKYVYIKTLHYKDGSIDIWNINEMLKKYFSEKGFIILSESTNILDEANKDPCLILDCDIKHTNLEVGVNRVTIILKNCLDEIVYSNSGSAMGFSMQDDFNKATKRAFADIKNMTYSFDPSKSISQEIEKSLPKLELTGLSEDSIKTYLTTHKLDPIEGIYKSIQDGDRMLHYKIGMIKSGENYKAIILDNEFEYWQIGEVKAIFEPSSMKGLYSVKWYLSNKTLFETFGSIENNSILTIEFKNSKTGAREQGKFIKLYPTFDEQKLNPKKNNSKASGSGFFITSDGIIATNAHVIEGASYIEIILSNEIGSFTYKAKVLLVDSKNDIALIKVDDEKFKGLTQIPFSIIEKSEVGEKVFTIGYPLNDIMGNNYKVTDGIISSKSGIADDVRYYQVSVPLQPGNSGGPLFNKNGNIIGITSARLNSKEVGTQVENVNYAIKSSYLISLYNMLPNSPKLSSNSPVATKELQEQVKTLKNFVCLIKIY